VNKTYPPQAVLTSNRANAGLGLKKNLSVLFPRSSVSPSFTTRDLNGIFTISSRYLIALPLPTTVAEGARSKRSLRLPE